MTGPGSDAPPAAEFGLKDALAVLNAARRELPADAPTLRFGLVTGFTPLHLGTVLSARLHQRRPGTRIDLQEGVFDDLVGGLEAARGTGLTGCVVVLDWADLDPRLGLRRIGGAGTTAVLDVVDIARAALRRLQPRIAALAGECPTVVALPVLPLPPVFDVQGGRVGVLEARLRAELAHFAAEIAATAGVRLAAAPTGVPLERDARAELRSGFPLPTPLAVALATAWAELLTPTPAKKGLVTDLDDTLWRGLVGEVGADHVSWNLDTGSQVHALYQRLLGSLADQGTLLAVSSKNEADVAAAALARDDLLVRADAFFPVMVSWGPKPQAVAEILRTWNIDAADVVFVDDNPTELAEVQQAFPAITALAFPTADPRAALHLLESLRDQFAKERVTDEDTLRAASIRAGAEARDAAREAEDPEAFLRGLEGRLTVTLNERPAPPRAYELVQKTNQFNLNGRRHDETEWQRLRERPGDVLATVAYQDRFGPLGIISVLAGRVEDRSLAVDTWVLSCRAFSRRIEHHILAAVAREVQAETISLDFVPTAKNRYTQTFVHSLVADPYAGEPFTAPELEPVHEVVVANDG